jgi:hypothetical protein
MLPRVFRAEDGTCSLNISRSEDGPGYQPITRFSRRLITRYIDIKSQGSVRHDKITFPTYHISYKSP